MNIEALNALYSRDIALTSLTAKFRCACGSIATADILTGEAACRCGRGTVTEYVRRVEARVIEREERRRMEARELMGERKVSRARKVRGVWK